MEKQPASIFREFLSGDIARVNELERICNPMPWSAADLRLYVADSMDASNLHRIGLVAELKDTARISGYVCASRVEDEAEILLFGVDPVRRRQGIGRAMLLNLIHGFKTMGCRSVFLEVRRGNVPAVSLYLGAGFMEAGIRKNYYSDTGEDARLMRRDLSV